LLLFNLPTKHSSYRVKVWRRLKKFGAIQLKTSTYVLPDEPAHYERFQWLAKEIVDNGGEAVLVRVKDIEGMPYPALVAMFNEARARDYDEVAEPLTLLLKNTTDRRTSPEIFSGQLQKLRQRFQEIYDIDFFQSSRGEDLERLFQKAESLESNKYCSLCFSLYLARASARLANRSSSAAMYLYGSTTLSISASQRAQAVLANPAANANYATLFYSQVPGARRESFWRFETGST